MVQPTETLHFRVRCRSCGRTVLSGVARVADAEATELRAHLARCRPDVAAPIDADLGSLLSWFDVARMTGGAQ